jgi:hypothetical protein
MIRLPSRQALLVMKNQGITGKVFVNQTFPHGVGVYGCCVVAARRAGMAVAMLSSWAFEF